MVLLRAAFGILRQHGTDTQVKATGLCAAWLLYHVGHGGHIDCFVAEVEAVAVLFGVGDRDMLRQEAATKTVCLAASGRLTNVSWSPVCLTFRMSAVYGALRRRRFPKRPLEPVGKVVSRPLRVELLRD